MVVAGAIGWTCAASAQLQEKVRDFATRPGVTVRTLEVVPAEAKAAILLFPGGDGGLLINPAGSVLRHDDNFLVRTRHFFADQGIRTYVVDVPSDRRNPPYMYGFRASPLWMDDVRALIHQVHSESKLPVWIAGFSASNGGVSGAAAVMSPEPGFAGAVMLSSCTNMSGVDVARWPLARIGKPVLVVHHRQDPCSACPPAGIQPMFERIAAQRKELIWFDGGGPAVGQCGPRGCDVCGPNGEHGFNTMEPEVVRRVADWIKQ
jgi:pimeloyl-ACP methyl ester carboxylesterase